MLKTNEEGLIVLQRTCIPVIRNTKVNISGHLDRNIDLFEHIDEDSLRTIRMQIRAINNEKNALKNPEPIRLRIYSPGGDVHDTLALVTEIRRSKIPIHGYAMSTVASCALMVLASCHKRYANSLTAFMHHSMISHTFMKANTQTFDEKLAAYKFTENIIFGVLGKRTKLSVKEWLALLGENPSTDKTLWFDADKALEYGLIDEIEDIWVE